MRRKTRWIFVPLLAATLAVSMAIPALADQGGDPNATSCGGVGSDGAGDSGKKFTCDDQGDKQASTSASCPGAGLYPYDEHGCKK
jgi:hypothetical protein